jgi:MFS superfamily sulfate permease-like transporter
MAVGLGAIAALLALERLAPKVPASLVVLAAGIAISAWLDLDQHGVEIVGNIPSAVPSLALPEVSRHEIAGLLGGGFGLALIVFAESFSISSRFARQHGYELDHPGATTVPGLLLVRPDGPVFFANANPLRLGVLQLVRAASPPPRVVVLILSSSFRLSVPTLDTLAELHDELQRRGIALSLARIRSSAMAELQASGLFDRLGPTHLHATVDDAVRAHTNSDRQSPSQ